MILFIFAAVTLSACGGNSGQNQPAEFVYGLTLPPSGIDPHLNASAELGIPLRSVYDTLIYRDSETGEFVPGLASSWTISDDGLLYTFFLRQDVLFHDGTVFNAQAVEINLARILNPANASQKAAGLLGPVQMVQALDEFTIVIGLDEPLAPLLDGLSQPYLGIASPTALSATDNLTYQFHQVGTGPYRFVEYILNDKLILDRNPDYHWGPSVANNPEVPEVERLVFHFYPDPASRTLALEAGDVQIVGELPPLDARHLSTGGLYQVQTVSIPGQPLQLMFNLSRAPTSSLAVRQALIFAADRQAISAGVFQGFRPIAYGPITSSTLFYNAGLEGRYTYDPIQANSLMNSTGWMDTDGDGWRDENGENLVINMVIPPWGFMADVAVLLEQQWESVLNIQVEITQVASFPMLVEMAGAGQYNAIGLNFFGYDPAFLSSFYETGGVRNWSNVADPQLDAFLDAAEAEMEPAARADLYEQIQDLIMEEALILPISEYVNLIGAAPQVQGLHFDIQGWFPYLTDIELGQ